MNKNYMILAFMIVLIILIFSIIMIVFLVKSKNDKKNNDGKNGRKSGPVTSLLVRPPQVPGYLTDVDPVRYDGAIVTVTEGAPPDPYSVISEFKNKLYRVSLSSRIETLGGLVCTSRPSTIATREPQGLVLTQVCVKQGYIATITMSNIFMSDNLAIIELRGKDAISVYDEGAITSALNTKLGTSCNVHAVRIVSIVAKAQ